MSTGDDDLFDDIETVGLDPEDVTESDTPLGRAHDDDLDAGLYDPKEKYDVVEERTRNSDYESTPGRVRTGGEKELDLGRVDVDSGGKSHGDGSGADWESNMSTRTGHVGMDGTGFFSDTRGSVSYTGQHDDVDPELHEEIRGAGLRLGINSVDTNAAGFALANSKYMASKERWRTTPQWYRNYLAAVKRMKRARREWEEVREASIHRHYLSVYNRFVADRTERDPYWTFLDDEEIGRMEGIDQRSARQMAERWRVDADVSALNAFIVKYAAFVGDVKPDSVRARFKRNKAQRDLAEFVFVHDCIECGVVMPAGFDKDELLAEIGGELSIAMEGPRTESQRRAFIIEGAHDFYAGGSLFPPYCWEPIDDMLDEVAEILEDLMDFSEPEEEIDWSRV